LLKFHGWKIVAIKGSHYQLKHHEINGRVTLPHPKDLPIGTLKSVLKQAKIKIKNE
jgi:predicted RNA binding protein YcfA (HicA-like mRNA interferase family)